MAVPPTPFSYPPLYPPLYPVLSYLPLHPVLSGPFPFPFSRLTAALVAEVTGRWTPAVHPLFPPRFRCALRTTLLCAVRVRSQGVAGTATGTASGENAMHASRLPPELWFDVFGLLQRWDFGAVHPNRLRVVPEGDEVWLERGGLEGWLAEGCGRERRLNAPPEAADLVWSDSSDSSSDDDDGEIELGHYPYYSDSSTSSTEFEMPDYGES